VLHAGLIGWYSEQVQFRFALKTGLSIAGDVVQRKNLKQAAKTRLKTTRHQMLQRALAQSGPPDERTMKRNAPQKKIQKLSDQTSSPCHVLSEIDPRYTRGIRDPLGDGNNLVNIFGRFCMVASFQNTFSSFYSEVSMFKGAMLY
jgi:hypothetical protein